MIQTTFRTLCMTGLLALSAIVMQAQDVIVKPKTKTEATTSTPKPKSETTRKTQQASVIDHPIISETFTANGVSFKMIRVEGGTFTMGATSEQGRAAADWEKPAHRVTLSSYYIGETEVTQALWKAVMGNNPSNFKGDNLPVESVSWDDCQAFINKLNSITGKNFRLPTEEEWEFAARGGNRSNGYRYSGSKTLGNVAWYKDNSGNTTHNVKTKSPNELGIYDMSGNVWEWTQSCWRSNYNAAEDCFRRVNRGGSWDFDARDSRVSGRGGSTPGSRSSLLGLRLALDK